MVTALALGGVLAVSVRAREGADDPDPARQRPGILDAGELPQPAPSLTEQLPAEGRRTVVFFERSATRAAQLCEAALATLPDDVAVVVVAPALLPRTCDAPAVAIDDDGGAARQYSLPRPRDGGPPVGYVIVDSAGWIRYRTLDPSVLAELGEVVTMLSVTP